MSTPVTRIRIRRKPTFFGSAALVLTLLALFLAIGFALRTPLIETFDESLGNLLRASDRPFLPAAADAFDVIGSTLGFAVVTLLACLVCLVRRRGGDALFVLASTVGAWLLNTAAKRAFERPRPELDALFAADGFSYPSGNATIGIALFGMIAVVFAASARSAAAKAVGGVVAAVAVLLLGGFRIYAGVHYPSDILGGYLLGGAYLLALIGIRSRRLP